MNAQPDDTTLTLWLDDELEGEDLARVDVWAAEHPEQLEAREQVRQWRKMIGESLPAAEEPPAPEFFNERIQHAILTSNSAIHRESTGTTRRRSSWGHTWMPVAACAGMVLAFWLGALIQPKNTTTADNDPASSTSTPHLYTPEQGVDAQWISSTGASATVIVLNGVRAIPDDVDFTSVALHRTWREIDSTASSESPTPNE